MLAVIRARVALDESGALDSTSVDEALGARCSRSISHVLLYGLIFRDADHRLADVVGEELTR